MRAALGHSSREASAEGSPPPPGVTESRGHGGDRGAPYDLPGGPDAVLLLHGLTGSPYELRPVAEHLRGLGLRCRAPVMAGHGGDPEALRALPWQAWVDAARDELATLEGARRTFLVGCSMGALVACALAAEQPTRVAGLALLAPALRLRAAGRLGAALGALPYVGGRLPLVPKAAGSDVADGAARAANPGLAAVPLGAVAQLARLARHVDGLLPRVRAPALVLAGGHDHTVSPAGVRRLASRLGGGARVVVLERSFHLLGIDVERDRCADEVGRFFTARAAAPGAGRG